MDTLNYITDASKRFYNEMKDDSNARYRSWEHCYWNFYHARRNRNVDADYLSLQLAFYLASWGMYRGSSFLLQKDYKIHIPIVEEILKKQHNSLCGIRCVEFKEESNQKLLIELNEFISTYYGEVRRSVKSENIKNEISATLITKILMGTLGCVPAYDRYFIAGIKNCKVATGTYSIKSVMQLADFYEKHAESLDLIRDKMKVYDLTYPQMKILDMGFWQLGYDLDVRNEE